ncbi:hypothetical protein H5410_031027 [Solanum commersonii]|uniref:Uncharacterized protein n=1 Tax=Solanum commersonii TaxID=4109 RepID=A0A9J5YHA7_SOLCO|nr:hypothetical protein H5410_031027 [Solanum commersonii]
MIQRLHFNLVVTHLCYVTVYLREIFKKIGTLNPTFSPQRREASPNSEPKSERGPGTKRKKVENNDIKKDIVSNLRMKKVLSGRVFDPDII